jgi:hypothetical protein
MSSKYRYEVVKQQIDGIQYISNYIKLKKVGLVYKSPCPFHNEKTPSLTVYPKGYINPKTRKPQDNVSFYCFGCGEGGDIIRFKQLKSGFTQRLDACIALEQEMGLEINDESAQVDYLQEQINYMKNSQGHSLSLTEINLVCSSMCRNYLLWLKESYIEKWQSEVEVVEKIYKYVDKLLLDMTAIEAMDLINELKEKLNRRRSLMKEGNNVETKTV